MDKLKDYLPVVSVVLTILGAIYTYAYYGELGFNIFSYLDITEILLLQFKLVVILVFMFFAALLTVGYGFAVTAHFFAPEHVEAAKTEQDTLKESEDWAGVAKKEAKYTISGWFEIPGLTIPAFSAFGIGIGIIHFINLRYSPILYPSLKGLALLGGFGALMTVTNKFSSRALTKLYAAKYYSNRPLADEIEKSAKLTGLIQAVFLLSLITAFGGKILAHDDLCAAPQHDATLTMEGRKIVTNDTVVYAGRTKNFVFLYNKAKSEAQIIPADKILQLDLRPGTSRNIIPLVYRNPKFFPKPVKKPRTTPAALKI